MRIGFSGYAAYDEAIANVTAATTTSAALRNRLIEVLRPASRHSCQHLDGFFNRIDAHYVAGFDPAVRAPRPAFSNRDPGKHCTLYHHWIRHSEHECSGCDVLVADVVKRPARCNAAFRARRNQD